MTHEPVQRTIQDMPEATVGEWRWLLGDFTGMEILGAIGVIALALLARWLWRQT